MIPIFLNPAATRLMLVGRGALALRRLAWLREAGAAPSVWSDSPSAELAAATQIEPRLPGTDDFNAGAIVWIADLDRKTASALAKAAGARGALVNVEDVPDLCDFHTPAVVHRGRLTLAAGTGGTSPAVASAVRQRLEEVFPEEWATALEEIAKARAALRGSANADALVADARARLARRGLVD